MATLRTFDADAEVFYEISRLQHLLTLTKEIVDDMPYERDGVRDDKMYQLNALARIAEDMLKRISVELGA